MPLSAAQASVGAAGTVVAADPGSLQSGQVTQQTVTRLGPSPWTGGRLLHPDGGSFDPKVTRWANLVLTVMDEQHIPRKRLPGILAQIQQESSGNPKAVNRWDSNARRGTPSKGLLQVIAPTYRHYAKPGFRDTKYQTVPYTNLYAALGYVKESYGYGKFKSWNHGANQGY